MDTSTDPQTDQGPPPPAELEYHPAASLFPLLPVDSQEFGELVDDIREHGLIQPIVLHQGEVLDGRNRLRACQHAGVEPRFEEWDGESPSAYVLSLNLHRRHLTDGQRAAIAVDAKARFEEEARLRVRQHGDTAPGRSATPRPNSDEVSRRDHRAERKRRSDVRAAKEVGVSRHAVRQAERVKKADPELFEQVKAGSVQLREGELRVEARDAADKLDDAVERYPFLRDVPGHQPARLLEVAATLDAAEDGERAAMEDQARRWCEAQRELMPQWRAEDEVTRVVDGIISRLASVNTTLSRHGAAEIANALTARIMPDNDIAIVRAALTHLSELDRELAGRAQIRRVK